VTPFIDTDAVIYAQRVGAKGDVARHTIADLQSGRRIGGLAIVNPFA
jgi:hypothetical protein